MDCKSHVPFYVQLRESLRQRIKRGDWKSGTRIPSELQLCQSCHVSRTVVRQALEDLVQAGVIGRRKGKGTFVSEGKINLFLVRKAAGFYEDLVDTGHRNSPEVLAHEVVPASRDVAHHLRTDPGASIVRIVRLQFADEDPLVCITTRIAYALCPQLIDTDLTDKSLYAVVEKECNFVIARASLLVQAVRADANVAKLLRISPGSPLIELESVSYTADGTPLEYYTAYYRGDQSRFEVELARSSG